MQSTPEIDLAAAHRFISALDPTADAHRLMTLPDSGKKPGLLTSRHAAFADIAADLKRLNRAGAGVFACPNRVGPNGRKLADLERIGAVYADLDNGLPFCGFPLDPTALIRTSVKNAVERFLALWLLNPEDTLTVAQFTGIERRLATDYGADPQALDPVRMVRVPGFLHQKNPADPQLVKVVGGSRRRVRVHDLIAAYPPLAKPERKAKRPAAAVPVRSAELDEFTRRRHRGLAVSLIRRDAQMLAQLKPKSGRNRKLFESVCRVGCWRVHEIITDADLRPLFEAARINGLVRDNGPDDVGATIEAALAYAAGDELPALTDRDFGQRRAA